MKLFLVLQSILLIYIFNSSFYSIYEKNNINDNSLTGYKLGEVNIDSLSKFYDTFLTNYPDANIQLIKNTVSSTKKSVYEIYSYPFEQLEQKPAVSSNIELKHYRLSKQHFIDSSGIFYCNLEVDEIQKIGEEIGIIINEHSDYIPYNKALKYNLFNFIILIWMIQIIYCIYLSYNFKSIGIKKSMGYSGRRIIGSFMGKIIKQLCIVTMVILIIMYTYLAANSRLSFQYIEYSILYFCIVIIINALLSFNTIVLIKAINLDEMIKNRTFNRTTNFIMQALKIIFSVVITVSISSLVIKYTNYRDTQSDILNYKELDGFYTANGFHSNVYDKIQKDPKTLVKYGNSTKVMYEDTNGLLCDTCNLMNIRYKDKFDPKPYEVDYIIANIEYINKFADLTDTNGNKLSLENIESPTLLVPNRYRKQEDEIKSLYIDKYNTNIHYNKYYKLQDNEESISNINIIYIGDGQNTKINTDNGFVNYMDLIILIDDNFGSIYYLDKLNGRNIFFEYRNLDEFVSRLNQYQLHDLVGAGTLLTPYMAKLENVQFTLRNIIMFCIVFSITLLFIIYMSNYVDILTNRKKYATKYILGYSIFRTLKIRYLIFVFWIIGGIISSIFNIYLSVFIGVGVIDFILLKYMFNKMIIHSVCQFEKGA
jgi:hypothetical protein